MCALQLAAGSKHDRLHQRVSWRGHMHVCQLQQQQLRTSDRERREVELTAAETNQDLCVSDVCCVHVCNRSNRSFVCVHI